MARTSEDAVEYIAWEDDPPSLPVPPVAAEPEKLTDIPSLTINGAELAAEYSELPGQIAFWALRAAAARRDFEICKLRVKQTYAVLDANYRSEPGIKITEKLVAASIDRDPRYLKAQEDTINAKFSLDETNAVMEALKAKRDMLVSYGAQVRAELPSY